MIHKIFFGNLFGLNSVDENGAAYRYVLHGGVVSTVFSAIRMLIFKVQQLVGERILGSWKIDHYYN
ncbi:hypothetical protein [Echinicola rosea]|nr:hypothetical protein [Echinicola rosea]